MSRNKDLYKEIKKQFDEWKPIVEKAGYELTQQYKGGNLLFIRLKNGIKHEIKWRRNKGVYKRIILTAFRHKQLEEVKQWFLEEGLNRPAKAYDYDENVCATTDFQSLEHWLDLAKQLEEINTIVRRGINEDAIFLRISRIWRKMFEEGMTAGMDRFYFDKIDHLVALNDPLPNNSYREHLVPLTLIANEGLRMLKSGASDSEIAVMLQQNVFVYHITKQQAKHLDITLGLRTTMPEGWKFGDSVFARLEKAGIKYKTTRTIKLAA